MNILAGLFLLGMLLFIVSIFNERYVIRFPTISTFTYGIGVCLMLSVTFTVGALLGRSGHIPWS